MSKKQPKAKLTPRKTKTAATQVAVTPAISAPAPVAEPAKRRKKNATPPTQTPVAAPATAEPVAIEGFTARFAAAPFLKHLTNGGIGVVVAESPDSIAAVARIKYSAGEVTPTVDWNLTQRPRGEFLREWVPFVPYVQPIGSPERIPLSVEESLRRMIKGAMEGSPPTFGFGALEALVSIFPEGPVNLFEKDAGFIHRFKEREDALLVANRWGGTPIIFESTDDLVKLDRTHLEAVAVALDAKTPPAKINTPYLKEIIEMASKAKGKQSKKVTSVKNKAKRADGTVAKLRAYFDSIKERVKKGELATADVVAECLKRGYTKSEGTIKTQFQWWRADNGVKATFKRPKKVAPAVKKAAKEKKAAAKPAKASGKKVKKASGKKDSAKPAPAGASAAPKVEEKKDVAPPTAPQNTASEASSQSAPAQ